MRPRSTLRAPFPPRVSAPSRVQLTLTAGDDYAPEIMGRVGGNDQDCFPRPRHLSHQPTTIAGVHGPSYGGSTGCTRTAGVDACASRRDGVVAAAQQIPSGQRSHEGTVKNTVRRSVTSRGGDHLGNPSIWLTVAKRWSERSDARSSAAGAPDAVLSQSWRAMRVSFRIRRRNPSYATRDTEMFLGCSTPRWPAPHDGLLRPGQRLQPSCINRRSHSKQSLEFGAYTRASIRLTCAAIQQDVVVLPTPPFPPTNIHCKLSWSIRFLRDGSRSSNSAMVATCSRYLWCSRSGSEIQNLWREARVSKARLDLEDQVSTVV